MPVAALATVQDYLTAARVLLQDQVVPYRYSDAELVEALNEALLESRRLRPDFYIGTTVPSYSASSLGTAVAIDQQYRVPFMYFIVGRAQLRDDEDTQDARAAAFLTKFTSTLVGLA